MINKDNIIYQDSHAYRLGHANGYKEGHREGYNEMAGKVKDIVDKSFEAGYKDAMDFAIDWLKRNTNHYTYNGGDSNEYIPKVGGKCWEDLKKDMEERLCRETSK